MDSLRCQTIPKMQKGIHTVTRAFRLAGLALAFLLLALPRSLGVAETPALSPAEALARLRDGNARFVAAAAQHPDQAPARRTELTQGQHPFAVVLTCADSRVVPEILFDQGLGDIFVIRNAGNLLDDHVIASIEYAVEHLHAPLVIVLGHSKCGAVSAAVAGGELPGHLPSIAASLEAAVAAGRRQGGDVVDNAVRINATEEAKVLANTVEIVSAAVKSGKVKVVAARYDIADGRVEILP